MTNFKDTPQAVSDADLDTANGGAAFLKTDGISARSKDVDGRDPIGKRDIGSGGKPAKLEPTKLGYTEVEWTY